MEVDNMGWFRVDKQTGFLITVEPEDAEILALMATTMTPLETTQAYFGHESEFEDYSIEDAEHDWLRDNWIRDKCRCET
jgi:hypothetical protein